MSEEEAWEMHWKTLVFPPIPKMFKKSVLEGAYAHNRETWFAALEWAKKQLENKHELSSNSNV